MIVYWSILIWVAIIGLFSSRYPNKVNLNGVIENRVKLGFAVLIFSYIIFFIGLRSGIADTWVYIRSFIRMPTSILDIQFAENAKETGFTFFSVFIRQFISKDFHVWLFIISTISGVCTLLPLKKYSPNFTMSAFLFVASCNFTWMLNGIRQYLVASILFACVGLILNRKVIWFIIVVFLLSTFHSSVIISIPIYFIVQGKPWNKKTLFFILVVISVLLFTNGYMEVLDDVLNNTAYEGAIKQFEKDDGINIIRILIAAMPMSISWIYRKKIEIISTPIINLCINMSIITTGIYLAASVTSGILVGRLPIYFELYNMILLPWLLSKCFKPKEKPIVYFITILSFLGYFYYQMEITWGGLSYISDVLGIYI